MTYKAQLRVVPNDVPNWVVPNDVPKYIGKWIDVACDDAMVERIKASTSWVETIGLFKNYVPLGHKVLQIDLKCVMELRPSTKTLRFEDID